MKFYRFNRSESQSKRQGVLPEKEAVAPTATAHLGKTRLRPAWFPQVC